MINFIRYKDLSDLQKEQVDKLGIPEKEKDTIVIEPTEPKKKGRKKKNV